MKETVYSINDKLASQQIRIIAPVHMLLVILYTVTVFLGPREEYGRMTIALVGLAGMLLTLLYLKRNIHIAALFFFSSASVGIVWSILMNGGTGAPAYRGLIVMAILAPALFNKRTGFILFLGIIIFSIASYIMQLKGWLREFPPPSPTAVFSATLPYIIYVYMILRIRSDILLDSLISQQEQSEVVKRSHRHLESILNTIGDSLLVCDESMHLIRVNKACCILLNSKEEDLIGKRIQDVTPLYTSKGKPYQIKEPKGEGIRSERLELQLQGINIPLLYSCDQVSNEKGKKNGLVITLRDISKEELLRQQLHHSQKMEAVGRLSSGIAHDFNNMLAGIMMAADHLEGEVSGENLEMVEAIQQTGERAAKLIRQLLHYGRKGKFRSSRISLHDLIHQSLILLKRTLPKSIRIAISEEAYNPFFEGDDSQIQSCLTNLAINAAHAMPNGGMLRFTTANVYLDNLFCQNVSHDMKPGQYIKLDVTDTGVGIPPENLPRIFDPFFTTRDQGDGSGLGLAAVYGVVENHGGYIEVESQENKGTTFHIFLPVLAPEPTDRKK